MAWVNAGRAGAKGQHWDALTQSWVSDEPQAAQPWGTAAPPPEPPPPTGISGGFGGAAAVGRQIAPPAPAAAPAAPAAAAPDRSLLMSSLGNAQPGASRTAGMVAPPPQRTSAELIARLRALVNLGLLDPRQLLDATGQQLHPEVLARLDALGPYNPAGAAASVTPGVPTAGGIPGSEFANPAEFNAETAAAAEARAQRADLATQTGYVEDPRTGRIIVTAGQGMDLLKTFGSARAAEDQYRAQIAQNAGTASDAYGQYDASLRQAASADAAIASRIASAQRQLSDPRYQGSYAEIQANIGDLQAERARQQAASQASANQALMAYNRTRGIADRYAAAPRPIGVGELARGATGEQWDQYTQAVRQGYDPEEYDRLMRGEQPRSAGGIPGQTYRQAMAARGYL